MPRLKTIDERSCFQKTLSSTKAVNETKMEWTLGITDSHPRLWKQTEPIWDETLTISSTHTFYQLMEKLCSTAIEKRRDFSCDGGIESHVWNMKIVPFQLACPNHSSSWGLKSVLVDKDDCSSESDEESHVYDEYSVAPKGKKPYSYRVEAPSETAIQQQFTIPIEDETRVISHDTRLSPTCISSGAVIYVEYDYGNTTRLYLKVLSRRLEDGARSLLQYFDHVSADQSMPDLSKIQAYGLSKEQQIDAFFPNFSKAFLGHGNAGLGLSSRYRRDDDTAFSFIENTSSSFDLFFCGSPFTNMNTFLDLAERAWTPSTEEALELRRYRPRMTSRIIFPTEASEAYRICSGALEDEDAMYGPKMLLYREQDMETQPNRTFDFAKVFPKTNAQILNGKFRWFKYSKGVLRVLVGRGVGTHRRDFTEKQVLRTVRKQFDSLHELLCCVEASWVRPNEPQKDLLADDFLEEFDKFLGPSRPFPGNDTPTVVVEDNWQTFSDCDDLKKLVTALAIAREGPKHVLYSGHDDGTLSKWDLDTCELIWSKQIYPDQIEPRMSGVGLFVRETMGVAGIALRKHPERDDKSMVYTWTDSNNYCEQRSSLVCWDGSDGSYVRQYACDVGDDCDGDAANPSIATVVFCRLLVEDEWVDSIIVGLHCMQLGVLKWNRDYSDFNLEDAQGIGEGNILPFYEHYDNEPMDTWVEHTGIIRAMAVIPDKYLFTYSMRFGHGLPDAMILWSLTHPGVPLCRHDFWDPYRHIKQSRTRLGLVDGISICGTEILLCDQYGDRVAAVSIDGSVGTPRLVLHGYAKVGTRRYEGHSFHGRMATGGKFCIVGNGDYREAWLFDVETPHRHVKLDRREGNRGDVEKYDDDDTEEAESIRFSGRDISVGRVLLPHFGKTDSVEPKRKRQKKSVFSATDRSDGECKKFGKGGPVAVALKGRYLVAGFSTGSITRAYLPDKFDCPENQSGANEHASCSHLPPDEWRIPALEN